MAKVFMCHSKSDKIGRIFFDKLLGSSDHEGYWYSWEGPKPPHAVTILEAIKDSASVFVLLSRPMTEPHTRSWVGYEVGIAVALKKNVWVFEPKDKREHYNVPVPYLTGYIQYPKEIDLKDTFPYFEIVKSAGTNIPSLVDLPFPHTSCGYVDCQAPYFRWVYDPDNYLCPVCRRKHVEREEGRAIHFVVNGA